MIIWDTSLYVWYKLSRVTGKAGKCNTFASMKCDAVATGLFTDSVTRVGTITVRPRQSKEEAFQLYKEALIASAEDMGYTNNMVFCITRKEYKVFLNEWLKDLNELEEQFDTPPYTGERMVKK